MNVKESLSRVVDSAKETLSNDKDERPRNSGRTQKKRGAGLRAPREGGPDALELLKHDHETVKALFDEVLKDESDGLSAQRKTVARILHELALHAKIEESLVYPAIRQKTKRDTEDRHEVLEAFEEHGTMKDLMRKIKRSTGRDETLRAKVQVLSEIVAHHVKEEESELFDEARRLLGEKKLHQIGGEIAQIKERDERRTASAKSTRGRNSSTSSRGKAKSETT